MSKIGGSDSKNSLYCSFCGKSQHEVRKLIAELAEAVWASATNALELCQWTLSARRTSPC